MAATASLLTGLLVTAKAASIVTEEEQEKAIELRKQADSNEDAPRGAA